MRDVTDVRVTVEGQRMVLAQREELDRPLDELADRAVRPAVALGRKRGEQLRVAFVSARRVVHGAEEARRTRLGARRVEVHAEGLEDLRGVTLELLPARRRDRARPGLLPMRRLLRVEGQR